MSLSEEKKEGLKALLIRFPERINALVDSGILTEVLKRNTTLVDSFSEVYYEELLKNIKNKSTTVFPEELFDYLCDHVTEDFPGVVRALYVNIEESINQYQNGKIDEAVKTLDKVFEDLSSVDKDIHKVYNGRESENMMISAAFSGMIALTCAVPFLLQANQLSNLALAASLLVSTAMAAFGNGFIYSAMQNQPLNEATSNSDKLLENLRALAMGDKSQDAATI